MGTTPPNTSTPAETKNGRRQRWKKGRELGRGAGAEWVRTCMEHARNGAEKERKRQGYSAYTALKWH
eukprot:6205358-Pleurochrysis_carterae.AAC.1